ncbi:hypothetical protein NIES4071_40830 [Calothrix sp. NIES-4071]|nr:hypothetical protein NIES4071_40830 [Calothrix sp. NIES-4071]BAZ58399.1 hypothetical protein NIES4105_40770 [Calothrix sp. NIES-4105]
MKLSFKDIQFIIEALNNLISTYEQRLDSEDIHEDEASDIGNDCMFLEALRDDLVKNLKHNIIETQVSLSSNLPNIEIEAAEI